MATNEQKDKPSNLANALPKEGEEEQADSPDTKTIEITGPNVDNLLGSSNTNNNTNNTNKTKLRNQPKNPNNLTRKANLNKNNTAKGNAPNAESGNESSKEPAKEDEPGEEGETGNNEGNNETNNEAEDPSELGNTNTENKEENKEKVKNPEIMSALNKLAMNLLNHQIILKLYHFQTAQYGAHKASDGYLEKFAGTMDKFLEIAQGIYGKLTLKKYTLTGSSHSDSNIGKHIDGIINMLRTKIDNILAEYTDLINVRDEMVGDLEQLKYLLTFT